MLQLTKGSAELMRSTRQAVLVAPKVALPEPRAARTARERSARRGGAVAAHDAVALSSAERDLFEVLRALRRELAGELGVPPYVVFGDVTLEELARVRPSCAEGLIHVKGVGHKKLVAFGERFLAAIAAHCSEAGLSLDAAPGSRPRQAAAAQTGRQLVAERTLAQASSDADPEPAQRDGADTRHRRDALRSAAELFARETPVADVAREIRRAISTTIEYLVDYIAIARPSSIAAWVPDEVYAKVARALSASEDGRIKPAFEALHGKVPYEQIRLVAAHLRARGDLAEA